MSGAQPSLPVVSSSTTLWASASKEWVIPAKPKPGRKPKKDPSNTTVGEDESTGSKGRRVQNRRVQLSVLLQLSEQDSCRAAQRAFRERKQSQLAELQARIQQYEQGEIERNVALQTVAKRLKEENEILRKENTFLKEKIAQHEREREENEIDIKRSRDNSSPSVDHLEHPVRKRAKLAIGTIAPTAQLVRAVPIPFISSPPSMASSPDSNDTSESSFSPMALASPMEDTTIFPPSMSLGGMFDFPQSAKPSSFDIPGSMDNYDCGFCDETTPCVCRELGIRQERPDMSSDIPLKTEIGEEKVIDLRDESVPLRSPILSNRTSILDNLPAYQPAVPLRRRPGNSGIKSLFPVYLPSVIGTASSNASGSATCSGDPSNCMACADDVFGKAFCTAIGESVASEAPCADCPSRAQFGTVGSSAARGCCGNPGMCGSSCGSSSKSALLDSQNPPDTMPTNDAWRQLKSHPNVAFSDLSLLADVVARRSKCTGPRVVLSPPPRCITPERTVTPTPLRAVTPASAGESNSEGHPVLLTDPHAHYRQRQEERFNGASSPPRLVPQEELVKCGRPRLVREVHAEAVREAIRLLDAKFGQT